MASVKLSKILVKKYFMLHYYKYVKCRSGILRNIHYILFPAYPGHALDRQHGESRPIEMEGFRISSQTKRTRVNLGKPHKEGGLLGQCLTPPGIYGERFKGYGGQEHSVDTDRGHNKKGPGHIQTTGFFFLDDKSWFQTWPEELVSRGGGGTNIRQGPVTSKRVQGEKPTRSP